MPRLTSKQTPSAGRQTTVARLDLGHREDLHRPSILFSFLAHHQTPASFTTALQEVWTKTPNPDPNQQSIEGFCALLRTKKEILLMIKSYYVILLGQQSDGAFL